MSDILCSLGLCMKAGKLIAGFNVVCDAIKQKPRDIIVFVTKDISDKTKKEVTFYADKYCVQVVSLPVTSVEINRILHKDFVVLAVTDIKLAGMIKSKCD